MIRAQPLILIFAAVVACGRSEDGATLADSATGAISDTGATVVATLSEWKIETAADTVAPGRFVFRARNDGSFPHVLEVEGNNAEAKTARIAPKQSDEVIVELAPGVYELYCPLTGPLGKHRDLGMKRTLVVRGNSSASSQAAPNADVKEPSSKEPSSKRPTGY